MAGIGSRLIGERLAALFAALALVVQILVPPGYMVARLGDAPTIVPCTGHGPMMAMGQGGSRSDHAPATDQGHVCVFAGHGGLAPAPTVMALVEARISYLAPPSLLVRDLRPGRGLAAPPPPPRGPPDLSI